MKALHRVDLFLGPECTAGVIDCRCQRQQRVAHLLLAHRVPFRHLKLAGAAGLLDLDSILRGTCLLQVLRIVRVD